MIAQCPKRELTRKKLGNLLVLEELVSAPEREKAHNTIPGRMK